MDQAILEARHSIAHNEIIGINEQELVKAMNSIQWLINSGIWVFDAISICDTGLSFTDKEVVESNEE